MFSIPSSSPVLIGGSRSLVSGPAALACSIFARRLARSGHAIHVGCAVGADALVVSSLASSIATRQGRFISISARHPALLSSLHLFACFAQGGQGSWGGSNVWGFQSAVNLGASVSWLAGGSLSVPLVARLMSRSLAALQGCAAAVFFQPGVGSLKVARAALKQGIPVLVCQQGCPVAPVLAVPPVVVSWFGMSFWLYQPAIQSALF